MKFINPRLALVVVLALFSIGLTLEVTGCKNGPRAAYTAGTATTITVEAALSGPWNAYVAAKHPSKDVEKRVASAFANYKKADVALLQAGRDLLAAQQAIPPNPDNVQAARLSWQTASALLITEAERFYALLKELGVKLP